jgi:uncharacterized protein YlxW (UPF0749 family)
VKPSAPALESRRPPPPPDGLLGQLLDNTLEEDYRTAAAQRSGQAPGRTRAGDLRLLAGLAVFGILVAVSAVETQQGKPAALAERTQLIAQINVRQARLNGLHTSLRELQSRIAHLQTTVVNQAAGQTRLDSETSTLGVASGMAAVAGPGLVITADNAAVATPGAGGTIMDSDLQALVNGLWAAGAEAVAVNGQRVTALTSIRTAGQAITVNYHSLTPPYVVEAVGNPDTLPARFLQTPGGQLWLALRSNYGITFRTRTADRMELSGRQPARLLWAHAEGSR